MGLTEQGRKEVINALEKVWDTKEGLVEQEANHLSHKIKSSKETVANQVEAVTDPDNAAIKEDILASISKKKLEILDLEDTLSKLSDKEQLLRFAFAFAFVDDMGSEFFEISRENRLRCKQLIFPGGFYLNANKKVYTPEISQLYRLATNKKDLSITDKSHLVRVGGL